MEFKEIWQDVSLRLVFKGKGGKQHLLSFYWFYPGGWDIFERGNMRSLPAFCNKKNSKSSIFIHSLIIEFLLFA